MDCSISFFRSGPKEAQVQSYWPSDTSVDYTLSLVSPGGINVPTWEGTLAPRGEYDWIICLRRWCSHVELLWPLFPNVLFWV